MLSRQAKATFYFCLGPAMWVSGAMYRVFRAPRSGNLRVHLGPGQSNYLKGWINVDANIFSGKADVWADLRNPLPFHDDTVETLYSHHVIEHLPNLRSHLAEALRCLKPGGVYRMAGPNGDSAIAKFVENDAEWFTDFPDKRRSIGGRLENFIFCRQEHLTILTKSFLEELLEDTGFVNIQTGQPITGTSYGDRFRDCMVKEYESDPDCTHTLVIEAEKPS